MVLCFRDTTELMVLCFRETPELMVVCFRETAVNGLVLWGYIQVVNDPVTMFGQDFWTTRAREGKTHTLPLILILAPEGVIQASPTPAGYQPLSYLPDLPRLLYIYTVPPDSQNSPSSTGHKRWRAEEYLTDRSSILTTKMSWNWKDLFRYFGHKVIQAFLITFFQT